MSVRFVGQQPQSFMDLPWLGEVEPGDVLSGAAAHAVAGRSDFENVDESPEQDAAADASAADVLPASADAPAEPPVAKPRRTAVKPDVGA